MTDNSTPLGSWIRESLSKINKNQSWLADKIHVKPPHISRIISGESEATAATLSAIADALGKSRAQAYRVAGYIEKQTREGEQVEELTHIYDRLNNSNREDLLDYGRLRLQKQERDKAAKHARAT